MTYLSVLPFDLQHLLKYYENYDHWKLLDLLCTYGFSNLYLRESFGVYDLDWHELKLNNQKIKYTFTDILISEKMYKRTTELDVNQIINKNIR
jgi:hypothetical protein